MPVLNPQAIVIDCQDLQIDCGQVVLTVRTRNFCFLWLMAARTRPLDSPVLNDPLLRPRVHRLNYFFVTDYGIRQEENGETLIHTFRFPFNFPLGTIYYMLFRFYDRNRRKAQTPIFACDLDWTTLVRETWPGNDGGDWGWIPSLGTGGSLTWNKGSVSLTGSGIPSGAGMHIFTASIPGFTPQFPCNSFVAIQLKSGTLPFNKGYATVTFEQQQTVPAYFSQAILLVDRGQNQDGTPRTVYQEGNAASSIYMNTETTLLLGQVFFHAANGKPPTGGVVDPNVPVTQIIINATTNVAGTPPATTSLVVGPITLGVVTGSPIRVDRRWRTLQNPVFIMLFPPRP